MVQTIVGHLQKAGQPLDLDLLKLDIDCYDYDVLEAVLAAVSYRASCCCVL